MRRALFVSRRAPPRLTSPPVPSAPALPPGLLLPASFPPLSSPPLPARSSLRAFSSSRKPGVATNAEMDAFLATHDVNTIIVLDARSTDLAAEPEDARWDEASGAPVTACGTPARPQAMNLPYDRSNKKLDLADLDGVPKDTPVITHCGGGGRGQKAKDFLISQGFTNVLNGGGPSVKDNWDKFGQL